MSNPVNSLTFFDFNLSVNEAKQEEWMQITQLNDICRTDKEPRQKIIRLSPEKQRELYDMLKLKFEGRGNEQKALQGSLNTGRQII